MKNIYLVGFMGTGKTVTGKILSGLLGADFIEMDDVIEKQEGKKISDIFSQKGEAHFRSLEKKLLKELSERRDLVVSCGGGLICNEENSKILKSTGVVINLKAKASTILSRTKNSCARPLLNVDDPLRKINDLLKERQPYYDLAHYSIDTDDKTPDEVAQGIIKLVKK